MSRNYPANPEQHVPFAYCAEMGRVVDIFQAQNFYFGQQEPRCDLTFRCPYTGCTGKIFGINYRKSVAERKKRPHFRSKGHPDRCEYGVEPTFGASRARGSSVSEERRKSNGIIDVFLADERFEHRLRRGQPKTGFWRVRPASLDSHHHNDQDDQERGCNKSSILSEVVSSYEELDPEQRRFTRLILRKGGHPYRTNYERAFRRIRSYQSEELAIFWGGAFVKRYGEPFTLHFYDKVDIGDGLPSVRPFITISLDRLRQYRFGSLLESQLVAACDDDRLYLRVYFLGTLRRTGSGKLQVAIDNFDHLAFIDKEKREQTADARGTSAEEVRPEVDEKQPMREPNFVLVQSKRDTDDVRSSSRSQASITECSSGPAGAYRTSDAVTSKCIPIRPSRSQEPTIFREDQQSAPTILLPGDTETDIYKQLIHDPHRPVPNGSGRTRKRNPLSRAWDFLKTWYRSGKWGS